MNIDVTPNVDRNPPRSYRTGELVPAPNTWHKATGDDLPGVIWFRLVRGRDDQWVCTELNIESRVPLTSTVLRKIPLSRIIDTLLNQQLEYMDRGGPLDQASGLREWYDGGPTANLTLEEFRAGGATAGMTKAELDALYLPNAIAQSAEPRVKRGGPPPPLPELERFAAAYKRALQIDRRHAVARTMRILASEQPRPLLLSRATANRWRDRCRKADPPLLDPE
jgi:hypothetical protein